MEGRRYTIKQLPPELRPRERLLEAGPGALSNAELLGILLGIGNREKTAVELASEVISTHGDLFGLYGATVRVPEYKVIATDLPCHPGQRECASALGATDGALRVRARGVVQNSPRGGSANFGRKEGERGSEAALPSQALATS